jgi:hypothetical protein
MQTCSWSKNSLDHKADKVELEVLQKAYKDKDQAQQILKGPKVEVLEISL